jgi:aminodeoxyfutalosine deaminase
MSVQPIGVTELHLHLEGSLSVESAVEIARQRSHAWGAFTPAQLRKRFAFADFFDFLRSIRDMCMVLASTEALERAAYELSLKLRREGVEYAEVYSSPYIYVRWGLDYGEVLRAVDRGFERGEAVGGAHCAILLDSVRQWGAEAAEKVIDGLEANRLERVIGFGLGGEERVDFREFRSLFDRARSLGLRTVVHAGEGAGAEDVWKAIDVLGVDRVAHGIRAIDDDELLRTLASRRIPLDLAVTSNYRTRVVSAVPHPMRRLIDSGVVVTLSTDDPSLFRTDLPREYVRARRFAALTQDELQQVARNGVDASFASTELKQQLRHLLEQRTTVA